MPCNPSVARILLRKGEAFVRKKDPFTIQHTGEAFARIYPITLEAFANEERATFVASTRCTAPRCFSTAHEASVQPEPGRQGSTIGATGARQAGFTPGL